MSRSQLKSLYEKNKTEEAFKKYKSQRNYVVNLNKREKKKYFESIEENHNSSKTTLWKLCKPFLSDKSGNSNERIILVENDQIQSDNVTFSNTFNAFFTNITSTLNIHSWENSLSSTSDPIYNAIYRYANHPSIHQIKKNAKQDTSNI